MGIVQGIKQYGQEELDQAENSFRQVVARLEAVDVKDQAFPKDYQVFQSAAKLNLANTLRQQYIVRLSVVPVVAVAFQ